jgi:hypothetical protein
MSNGHAGYYMPDHQQATAQTTQRTLSYLSAIKPKPIQNSPLGKPIPPNKSAMARYNRALDIAQQPAVVLQHIKDGTLQPTDVADLKTMYPSLYDRISTKMLGHIANGVTEEGLIPYRTRVSASMFLGQPLDASMQPQGIMTAQSIYAPQPPPAPPQAKGRPSAMKDKSSNAYQTAGQAAESDRSNRS